MASERQAQSSLWIVGPRTDLICFSFGWIPALVVLVALQRASMQRGTSLVLLSVLMFNFLHRHLTFPLVYGDPEQFGRRRAAYLALPPIFLALTLGTYYGSARLFYQLETLAILWTVYHVVMQKVGLLRIYSRKSGARSIWLDKALPLAWLGSLALHGLASPSLMGRVMGILQIPATALGPLVGWQSELWFLALVALGATAVLTVLYVREELATPRFSWPKILYALSILMIFGTFYIDVRVGYAVFTFSHAVEYIAFVNAYAGKKYRQRPARSSFMARAVRHQVAAMAAYAVVMLLAFWALRVETPVALNVYITGSSFLHFIYDGWIWKTSDPAVGRPLGISYPKR